MKDRKGGQDKTGFGERYLFQPLPSALELWHGLIIQVEKDHLQANILKPLKLTATRSD